MMVTARSHLLVFTLNDSQVHTTEYPSAVNISKDMRLMDLNPNFYHWTAFAVAMSWVLELLCVQLSFA